jgi:hypothetical protein
MPGSAPLVLHLYGPDDEVLKTYSRGFIPWKMLKKGIALSRQIGEKKAEDYTEEDVDALTSYVMSVFGSDLTIEMLDEHADTTEMIAVIQSVVARARGIMDPTLPPQK